MVLREKDDADYYYNHYKNDPTQENLDQLIKYRPQDKYDAINKKGSLEDIRSEKKQKSILDFYETTIQYIRISDIKINERIRNNLNRSQVKRLSESINQIGLINPITITKKKILVAGNHRLHACKKIGWNKIPCVITTIEDSLLLELQEIDENLIRYELHFIDRGNHLKRRKEIYEEINPNTKKGISQALGMHKKLGHNVTALGATTLDQESFIENTFKETGISKRKIREDIQIVENISSEIQNQIKETEITKKDAIILARLKDTKKQENVVEKIKKKEAKGVKDAITQIRKEENEKKPKPKVPDGKFELIYADPPWQYNFTSSPTRSIEKEYSTMSLKEICELKIPYTDDCILFLWCPAPKLYPEGIEVIKAWGFVYKTCMVWIKDKIGMGYYGRNRHELLLIATRGKPGTPKPKNRPDAVIEAPRTKHSKKPEIVYELIEQMYPNKNKIELFARNERHNWKSWGNEIESK